MKNEPLFSFVAIAIVLGVFMAFVSAARTEEKSIVRDGTFSQTTATVPNLNP